MKRLNYSDYVHRDLIFTGSREKLYKHGNSRIRDDSEKRILRCSEGNRIWYQLWIPPGDMMKIEPLLEGGTRVWMREMYYIFFYEKKGHRRIGVLGKKRAKEILYCLL